MPSAARSVAGRGVQGKVPGRISRFQASPGCRDRGLGRAPAEDGRAQIAGLGAASVVGTASASVDRVCAPLSSEAVTELITITATPTEERVRRRHLPYERTWMTTQPLTKRPPNGSSGSPGIG